MNVLKVMVVDDEYPIRKWFEQTLKNLPNLKVEVVGTASNGEEALALFRERKPDVVFTDIKMPVLDGLDLLQMIKKEQPKTEVVMISSYDEFAYAKKAIKLNAFDYVLKQETNSKMLSELLHRIAANRQEVFFQKDALAARFEQEIFLNALMDEEKTDITGKELEDHGIYLKERGMFAIAFQTNRLQAERIPEVFMNEGVENVLYYSWQKNVQIALGNTACIEQLAYQNQVIFQFAGKLGQCFDSPVGISGPYFEYRHLVSMIKRSIQALNQSFYQRHPSRMYYARDVSDFEELRTDLELLEQSVMEYAKNGEREKAQSQIVKILDEIEEKAPGDVQTVKQFLFRLTSNVCQALCQDFLRLPDVMGELFRNMEKCDRFGDVRKAVLDGLDDQAQETEKLHYSPYVSKAMAYIEQHFGEIVYITDVAGKVGLNEDYLGHIFKSETGATINQFLNNTRMNRAIWLLNNTQLKTYEIAYKVGYANSGYFSKLFKQKFGVSPYEFRNLRNEKEREE